MNDLAMKAYEAFCGVMVGGRAAQISTKWEQLDPVTRQAFSAAAATVRAEVERQIAVGRVQ